MWTAQALPLPGASQSKLLRHKVEISLQALKLGAQRQHRLRSHLEQVDLGKGSFPFSVSVLLKWRVRRAVNHQWALALDNLE